LKKNMKVSKTSIGKTNGKTYFYVLSLFFFFS
jgi:hypothetical protein